MLATLDMVLEGAGLGRGDLTDLTIHVTDSTAALVHDTVPMGWIGEADPPQSPITVSGQAFDGMVIEISARAAL